MFRIRVGAGPPVGQRAQFLGAISEEFPEAAVQVRDLPLGIVDTNGDRCVLEYEGKSFFDGLSCGFFRACATEQDQQAADGGDQCGEQKNGEGFHFSGSGAP